MSGLRVLLYVLVYLTVGAGVLANIEVMTKGRLRRNVEDSTTDMQEALVGQTMPASRKTSKIVLLVMLWLFWPWAVYGAAERAIKDRIKTRASDRKHLKKERE